MSYRHKVVPFELVLWTTLCQSWLSLTLVRCLCKQECQGNVSHLPALCLAVHTWCHTYRLATFSAPLSGVFCTSRCCGCIYCDLMLWLIQFLCHISRLEISFDTVLVLLDDHMDATNQWFDCGVIMTSF
ncbi:hypothetical protein F4604DRAFT_1850286, partial [Suillus subluteus]